MVTNLEHPVEFSLTDGRGHIDERRSFHHLTDRSPEAKNGAPLKNHCVGSLCLNHGVPSILVQLCKEIVNEVVEVLWRGGA